MARKIDIEKKAPEHCAEVNVVQSKLQNECGAGARVRMLCPYCKHPVATVFKGEHSSFMAVCPKCCKEVFFPPIKFRRAKCS